MDTINTKLEVKNLCWEYKLNNTKTQIKFKFRNKSRVGGTIIGDKNNVRIRALSNVSFSATSGDKIGIVGPNGAGKTTLLRTISGIIKPDSGEARVVGKLRVALNPAVGAILDISVEDNIKLFLAYNKFQPSNISDYVNEILEWAELLDYRALPVRILSPGMQSRLYFSIATSIPSNVLLIDEWMGVGDSNFIKKAQKRFEEMIGRVDILVMCSHNENILSQLCNKVLKMEKGKIVGEVS